jgi:hypothetical protein
MADHRSPLQVAATLPVPSHIAPDLFAYGDYIGSEALMQYAASALPLAYQVLDPEAEDDQGRLFPWDWQSVGRSLVQDEQIRTLQATASEAHPIRALPALCALLRRFGSLSYRIIENVICPIWVKLFVHGRDFLTIQARPALDFESDLAEAVGRWIGAAEWRNSGGFRCRKRGELERCTVRLTGPDSRPEVRQHGTKLAAQAAVNRGEDECLLLGDWFNAYWFGASKWIENPRSCHEENYFGEQGLERANDRREKRLRDVWGDNYYGIVALPSLLEARGVELRIENCETEPRVSTYRATRDLLTELHQPTPGKRKVRLRMFFSRKSYERGARHGSDEGPLDWLQCDPALAEGLLAFLLSPLHQRHPCIAWRLWGQAMHVNFVLYAPLVPLHLIREEEENPPFHRSRKEKRKRSESAVRRVKPRLASSGQ